MGTERPTSGRAIEARPLPASYTPRVDEGDLGRRAQAGDTGAWAEIYDRYADRLHDYCWTILRDRHEAEDALHDAFVTAAAKIHQLRDPERLRPWLYAVCRTHALARARRRDRAVPTDEVGEMTDAHVDHAPVEATDLQRIVWDAAGGLAERDRAVLDLHLRQGLVGEELAAALEVSPHHAAVLLSRVRDLVDRSLGALLVGRTGRQDCAELDALLAGWDGSLTPLVRKRVARHIERCEVCGERRKALVSPLALLAAMPLVPAPADLRERVLGDVALVSSSSEAGAGSAARGRVVRALGAAAAVVAVVVGALVAGSSDDGEPLAATGPTTTDGVPATTEPAPTDLTTTTTVTTTSTTSPPIAATAVLTLVSGPVDFGSDAASASALLRNDGSAAARWSASPRLAGLAVAPASGTLAPGASVELRLTLDRAALGEGAHTGAVGIAAVTVASGELVPGRSLAVSALVERVPVVSGLATDHAALGSTCPTAVASATVVDESAVTVVLQWQGASSAVQQVEMTTGGDGTYTGTIAPSPIQPVTWWVTATDARGNVTRSEDHTLPIGGPC